MEVLEMEPVIQQMRELFSFSPFGLCCRECGSEATITFDERCILRHLRKHKLNKPVAVVRCYLEESSSHIELARASRSIEPYRFDDKTYTGFSCSCGLHFQLRKDSAQRHCKKTGCDVSKLQKVELIKLCCGRYVSQSQVIFFL